MGYFDFMNSEAFAFISLIAAIMLGTIPLVWALSRFTYKLTTSVKENTKAVASLDTRVLKIESQINQK